ncbi:hypothetical protein [uncultured Duncaniella sp.]|uniref:hypothetical protein n=1 Tax=uncultured Duncaniella sp. TaxID=2768039 RepID=UPI00261C4A2E|nr:hypothetical protein [uncultured Duncaniella sp.]
MDCEFNYHGYEPPEEYKAALQKVANNIVNRMRQTEVRFTMGSDYEAARAANAAFTAAVLIEQAKKESEEDKES